MGPALVTLAVDVAKGLLPVLVALVAAPAAWVAPAGAVAAVLGHLFPIFGRFAGGKGVATGFGAFLALSPVAAGLAALIFAAVALRWRYASLASICAALSLPITTGALGAPTPIRLAAVTVAVLITARHRDNIARLRNGTEPRFRSADR
jgi:glycerol-3-phosphate acyltransferase PlsY